jgi:hypothetical protein
MRPTDLSGKRLRIAALAILAFTVIASEASAISRYDSPSMTCAAILSTIRAEGAVILRWPSTENTGNVLYDRFVAGPLHCSAGQTTKSKFIPSAGGKQCAVWRCGEDERFKLFNVR